MSRALALQPSAHTPPISAWTGRPPASRDPLARECGRQKPPARGANAPFQRPPRASSSHVCVRAARARSLARSLSRCKSTLPTEKRTTTSLWPAHRKQPETQASLEACHSTSIIAGPACARHKLDELQPPRHATRQCLLAPDRKQEPPPCCAQVL